MGTDDRIAKVVDSLAPLSDEAVVRVVSALGEEERAAVDAIPGRVAPQRRPSASRTRSSCAMSRSMHDTSWPSRCPWSCRPAAIVPENVLGSQGVAAVRAAGGPGSIGRILRETYETPIRGGAAGSRSTSGPRYAPAQQISRSAHGHCQDPAVGR
jgi:hypothetical protein